MLPVKEIFPLTILDTSAICSSSLIYDTHVTTKWRRVPSDSSTGDSYLHLKYLYEDIVWRNLNLFLNLPRWRHNVTRLKNTIRLQS